MNKIFYFKVGRPCKINAELERRYIDAADVINIEFESKWRIKQSSNWYEDTPCIVFCRKRQYPPGVKPQEMP